MELILNYEIYVTYFNLFESLVYFESSIKYAAHKKKGILKLLHYHRQYLKKKKSVDLSHYKNKWKHHTDTSMVEAIFDIVT